MLKRLRPIVLFAAWFMSGCPAAGVGDPCNPESIPQGGFVSNRPTIETSSVECRTRVCLIYGFQGDPSKICCQGGEPPGTCLPAGQCDPSITRQSLDDHIYCSCRCGGPADIKAKFCECPDGYSCTPVFTSELWGPGVRGNYCIRNGTELGVTR